jgi:murein DD-endopeptidase MepM/ murein hydrolase activator NlpD
MVNDTVKKIFNLQDDWKSQVPDVKTKAKVNALLNPTEYNPFLDRSGNLFNKYIDYQAVLDNPNVTQKAKEFISKATGLTSTPAKTENFSISIGQFPVSGVQTPETSNDKLGFISAKYESGGYNPGAISSGKGDYGGVSYGVSQFSTKTGSADKFADWLKKSNPKIGSYFGNAKAGTTEFSNAWKKAYADFGDEFANLQTQYSYDNFVKPLADLAKQKTGIDYNRSPALRELIYSTAIQFGGGNLGLSALGNVNANMSDKEIINASYDKKISNYKSFFSSSSRDVQESVKNRFANERNDVLALLDSSGTSNGAGFSNPLDNMSVTSNFGMRLHPIDKVQKMHYGIDLAAPAGTPIKSSTGGRVTYVGDKKDGYGISVYVDDGNGMVTRYSHMQSANAKLGDTVAQGQVIGKVGSTGKSTGPHLDFGVMINGKYVDPKQYLK